MAGLETWLEETAYPSDPHRPLVTLSYAQSLDGSLTSARGQPLAISASESMRITHQLRATHPAILVGIGTVLADDPRLNVRLVPGRDPLPVILDAALRCPPEARVVERGAWVCTTTDPDQERKADLEKAGGRVLELPEESPGRISLPSLMRKLHEEGISGIMVEGGATLIGSFLRARLVDRIVVTIAPVLVGGLPVLETLLPGPPFPRLESWDCTRTGNDLVLWGVPRFHE